MKSSTWLQNPPNYRNLFPAAFTARLRGIGGGSYLGVWGQFVRADGSANHARLADFQSRLATAHTLAEATAALPLNILEATGPIADFYAEYNIERSHTTPSHHTPPTHKRTNAHPHALTPPHPHALTSPSPVTTSSHIRDRPAIAAANARHRPARY